MSAQRVAATWGCSGERRHRPLRRARSRHRRFAPRAASVSLLAVHGAARHRRHRRADGGVEADQPQPLELVVVSRCRSHRRSAAARCASGCAPAPPRPGATLPDGQIYLLTHLRYAGYVFNPISLYYCYDRDGALRLRARRRPQHLRWPAQLLAAIRRTPSAHRFRACAARRCTCRRSWRWSSTTSSC